jgi:hypothetical protein
VQRIRPTKAAIVGARVVWATRLLVVASRASGGSATASRGVLAARHICEAVLLSRTRGESPPRWMIVIDMTHAASMLALAAINPRIRRDALASAIVSVGLAIL